MYRCILNPPWEPVDASNFKDAPNLVLNSVFDADKKPDAQALDLWNRYIVHTPSQIYDIFAGGFRRKNIRLDVDINDGGEIKFDVNEMGKGGFLSSLWLMAGGAGGILYSKIYVNEEAQGQGIGRIAMRNKVEVAAALGFEEFPFEAGLDKGGHVWAKIGGYLDRNEERLPRYKDHEDELSLRLTARLEAARPFIGKGNYQEALSLCQLQRPDDLVRLAHMGDLVVPNTVLDEACTVLPRMYYGAIGDSPDVIAKVKLELKYLCEMFYGPANGQTDYVRFPHYMQNETVWSGVYDFSNDEQMAIVGNNVGGWRILAPERELAIA